jgi:hypothetical protein
MCTTQPTPQSVAGEKHVSWPATSADHCDARPATNGEKMYVGPINFGIQVWASSAASDSDDHGGQHDDLELRLGCELQHFGGQVAPRVALV